MCLVVIIGDNEMVFIRCSFNRKYIYNPKDTMIRDFIEKQCRVQHSFYTSNITFHIIDTQ